MFLEVKFLILCNIKIEMFGYTSAKRFVLKIIEKPFLKVYTFCIL